MTFEPAAELFVVDTATGAARAVERASMRAEALAFNADGSLLLVADSQSLRVYTVAEPSRALWTWRVPGYPAEAISAARFAPDGQVLVAFGGRSLQGHITLRRCTLAAGAVQEAVCTTRSEPAPAFGDSRAFFSADATEMIFTPRRNDPSAMRVWPTASTGSEVSRALPALRVNALVAQRDQIFVAHTAGRLVERIAQSGQAGIRYPHDGFVHHLALSSDGRHLAAALSDPVSPGKNRVVVWRVDDGQEIARFTRPQADGPVLFNPDARRLYYVDGPRIHAVQWQVNDAVETVCSRVRGNLSCEAWRQWVGDEPYRASCPALASQCAAKIEARLEAK
jgi:sugar lactone lactonase YvrE